MRENTLSRQQIQVFIQDGFVRIDDAFPQELAEEGRKILWADTGCHPDDPTTWTELFQLEQVDGNYSPVV